ncbi:MAG: sigma-70 family RNA polymerase sigma factor [Actinobacteria bacterium]|nr:sigma-70 family RNA polymerase sigma factor [Actinomycetota bacterium]
MASSDDERALLDAARAGDRDALDRLLRQHYDAIHAVCRRITGNRADADDAAQDALMAIVRALPRFDDRARFSTWAYRVAVNASLDELRRRRRRPTARGEQRDDTAVLFSGAIASPEAAGTRVDVDAALATLAPEFRAAVVLRDLCQLDYAEIAEVLEVPIGTVRSRIARGRAALVPLLGNPTTPANRPTTSP